ncbi:MAG: Vi polysaccharide biosynthesis UDP-N-acetylglucosamine C-6 dehydrogenase TviB, partial [bacterium]|nr:Vi polysaccharide biosynthesis UDP-N-acetylglucosamine C-6 dehydrogenase TviB [bacterium]
VISAGRAVNDGMAQLVVDEVVEALGKSMNEKKVLVMGMTFKEDVPDTRNSQSYAVIKALQDTGCDVLAHDPQAPNGDIPSGSLENGTFDAVLVLVKHKEYFNIEDQIINATKESGVIYDLKNMLNTEKISESGRKYLSL